MQRFFWYIIHNYNDIEGWNAAADAKQQATLPQKHKISQHSQSFAYSQVRQQIANNQQYPVIQETAVIN